MNTIKDIATLGSLIRKERKNQRPTQKELAVLAGVGMRFVRELVRGKVNCRIWPAIQGHGCALRLALAVHGRESQAS